MDKKFKTEKLYLVKVAEITKITNSNGKKFVSMVRHTYKLFAKIYNNEGQEPVYRLMTGKKQILKTNRKDISEIGDLIVIDMQKASEVFPYSTMTFSEIKNAEFKLNGNKRFHLKCKSPSNNFPINREKSVDLDFSKLK